jgi:geranylgeranyl pyrophosphate synthase
MKDADQSGRAIGPASGRVRRILVRLIQDVIGPSTTGTGYAQDLVANLDQWGEPDLGIPTISRLPLLCCEASAGDARQAIPVMAAWEALRLAAKLFDDVEDNEASTPTEDVNVATGLLFVTQLALGELAVQGEESHLVLRLSRALDRAVLRACAGQHSDLVSRGRPMNIDPETWLEIAHAKSGELLGWAAWAGALVAGASEHDLACYHQFGSHLGVLLQVADDFNGIWHPEGSSDLAAGHPSLPICYAFSVTQAREREHLKSLFEQTIQGDEMAKVRLRQLLTDVGAQVYLLTVARVQHQQAAAALGNARCLPSAGRQLTALLDQVMPAVNCVGG